MSEPQLPKGVDQSFRKTFNPDDYKDRAAQLEKEKTKKAGEAPATPKDIFAQPQREPLKARDFEKIIFKDAPSGQKGGYFCETCQCVINDSSNYLDHINGRKHQKALGRSMVVERVGVDRVRAKLAAYKQKEEEDSKRKEPEFDIDLHLHARQMEDERAKRQKIEDKKRRQEAEKEKKAKEEEIRKELYGQVDPEMEAMGFGFASFGGSKK